MNTRQLVLNYLQSLLARGENVLPIDYEARGILRSWMQAARQGRASVLQNPAASTSQTQERKQPELTASAPIFPSIDEILSPGTSPEKEDEEVFFRIPEGCKEERWSYFRSLVPKWQPLLDLKSLRTQAVLGEGNLQADIMFVGDAPGNKDEESSRPFMGPAGDKLTGMLHAMGLQRDEVYITHLVKFRPALPRQTTNNRPPNDKEIALSSAILQTEINLLKPKVIVALGVIAARGILKLGSLPLAEYQSKPRFFGTIPVFVSHHPSYLLRTSDVRERRALWEEMLRVMELVGLPISDKQRAYFLKTPHS